MHLSPAAVINLNFLHHATYLQSLTPGMSTVYANGFAYSNSGLSCDTFNILYISEASAFDPLEFGNAVDHYDQHQLAFTIWINKDQLTPAVFEILAGRGLAVAESEPGMILDLRERQPWRIDADIRPLNDERSLTEFARIVSYNWEPPDPHVPLYYERVAPLVTSGRTGVEYFGYFVDGEAVAAIELFPDNNNNVGIYSLCTLASHRRKGIGTALLQYCLDRAREKGFHTATLQASDDGVNIYTKLGFVETTRFFEFKRIS